MTSSIPDRLIEMRVAHGYSQKYIAVTIGVSGTIVSQWESGQRLPSKKNLARLADLYGVSTDYLMGRTDKAEPLTAYDTGAALRTVRLANEMSLSDIASIADVSPTVISYWEHNKPPAPIAKLKEIANALNIPISDLIGESSQDAPSNSIPYTPPRNMIPVIGSVRCGEGGLAIEEQIGTEPADVSVPEAYFYLIAKGDSMEPKIMDGDYVLVHRQADVNNGELAVVIVDGDEGTLKRIIKKSGLVILEPLNHKHPTRYFAGEEINSLRICGKAVEIKRKL